MVMIGDYLGQGNPIHAKEKTEEEKLQDREDFDKQIRKWCLEASLNLYQERGAPLSDIMSASDKFYKFIMKGTPKNG